MATETPAAEAILIADFRRHLTRTFLLDVVDGVYRFVARGEAVTTVEPPHEDLTHGLQAAIQQIEFVASRPLLQGHDRPWLDIWRRRLEDVRLRGLECFAAARLGLGGPALAQAEECGRQLIELAPYRETGYRILMEALEQSANNAEALLVYDRLRVLLRDELGVAPSPAVQQVYRNFQSLVVELISERNQPDRSKISARPAARALVFGMRGLRETASDRRDMEKLITTLVDVFVRAIEN